MGIISYRKLLLKFWEWHWNVNFLNIWLLNYGVYLYEGCSICIILIRVKLHQQKFILSSTKTQVLDMSLLLHTSVKKCFFLLLCQAKEQQS